MRIRFARVPCTFPCISTRSMRREHVREEGKVIAHTNYPGSPEPSVLGIERMLNTLSTLHIFPSKYPRKRIVGFRVIPLMSCCLYDVESCCYSHAEGAMINLIHIQRRNEDDQRQCLLSYNRTMSLLSVGYSYRTISVRSLCWCAREHHHRSSATSLLLLLCDRYLAVVIFITMSEVDWCLGNVPRRNF